MKLLVLLIGIALGVTAWIYYQKNSSSDSVRKTEEKIVDGAERLKDKVSEAVANIPVDDIKRELKESGRIVRKQASRAGAAISDATADSRITAAIKGKYAVEKNLSALTISVNTTEGVVTLSGKVESYESIAQAIKLALETEGVTEVVSTLQVK
jgi:osmotically-inducible protein OsmY